MFKHDAAVRRLIDILDAQLDLVSDTTEAASTHLMDKITELHERLASVLVEGPRCEDHVPTLNLVMEIQMMLQFQDIVRQQIDTVRAGLTCLASAEVPKGENPEDWFQAQITRLEGAYVMRDQWDIHNSQLGIETAAVANGDDLTLF